MHTQFTMLACKLNNKLSSSQHAGAALNASIRPALLPSSPDPGAAPRCPASASAASAGCPAAERGRTSTGCCCCCCTSWARMSGVSDAASPSGPLLPPADTVLATDVRPMPAAPPGRTVSSTGWRGGSAVQADQQDRTMTTNARLADYCEPACHLPHRHPAPTLTLLQLPRCRHGLRHGCCSSCCCCPG